jgi:polyhydroxyalkanoate synthesis regulator phasin
MEDSRMKEEMKGKRILVSVFAVWLVIIFFCPAAQADQTDKLIKILIEKGVITNEEAKSLERRSRGKHRKRKPKEKHHPVRSGSRRSKLAIKKAPISKRPMTVLL